MPKKFTPDQFKFGLLLVLLLYLVNGQKGTAAKMNLAVGQRQMGAIASPASAGMALAPAPNSAAAPADGCATAQRAVQVEADAVLNLRSYPNGPVLNTLAPGTAVTVQRSEGQWSEVVAPNGSLGWSFNAYLGCR
jgi:hypothetical protein